MEISKDAEKRMKKLDAKEVASPWVSKKSLKKQEVERIRITAQMMYVLRGSAEELFRTLNKISKATKYFLESRKEFRDLTQMEDIE